MHIFNAIYIHNEFNHFLPSHLDSLEKLGMPVTPCLYYGMNGIPPLGWESRSVVLGCAETRDNMPLKTYGLIKHALMLHGWTHLFKTDVNERIRFVDWPLVEKSDYAGLVVGPDKFGRPRGSREYANHEREPILREPWLGNIPHYWCGGSGYIISRRLAQAVASRGAWAARGYFAEDGMIGVIAEELGMRPVGAVAYGKIQGCVMP